MTQGSRPPDGLVLLTRASIVVGKRLVWMCSRGGEAFFLFTETRSECEKRLRCFVLTPRRGAKHVIDPLSFAVLDTHRRLGRISRRDRREAVVLCSAPGKQHQVSNAWMGALVSAAIARRRVCTHPIAGILHSRCQGEMREMRRKNRRARVLEARNRSRDHERDYKRDEPGQPNRFWCASGERLASDQSDRGGFTSRRHDRRRKS
jgi:hypothetical protein